MCLKLAYYSIQRKLMFLLALIDMQQTSCHRRKAILAFDSCKKDTFKTAVIENIYLKRPILNDYRCYLIY